MLQHAPLRARGGRRLSAAVLSQMEQLPVQPDERLRPAPPERVLRRRHTRLRRPLRQGAQDGVVRLQSLLPGALLRQPVPAPYSDPQGHQVAGAQGRRRVHVQGGDQREPGTDRTAAQGGRVAQGARAGGREQ